MTTTPSKTRTPHARTSNPATRRIPRVRVERVLGRTSGAKLTIDHLQFYLEAHDLEQLAAQLVRVLAVGTQDTHGPREGGQ